MADEIKLKAPTVEQQVVVNINGEDKLKSFADTLDKISNNKNLQKYWKTQQDLINATADAYSNFQKKASKDNASELIKVTNALKAMSGTDLSHVLPDFDKISKSMTEAQKVAGNIDSAFSVKGFKEAFDSFEALKAYGTDIQKLFSHFGVSSDIDELQQNVRLLESEIEKLTRRLSNAKNANEELRTEFENFKYGSGFADKLDELDRLKSEMQNIRDEATQSFNQFLDANRIDRYDLFNDDRFAEYFEKLENGTLTASEAIRRFKSEYAYLLEESYKSNGDSFGIEQLQAFSSKLDSIFHQVEETSNKINDIISNGVIAKSVQNLSEDTTLSDSQRSIFGNLLQDEESLKSITSLFQKLIEESNQAKNTEVFNTEQFAKLESLFGGIESSLSSIKSVLVDVGDGEELSPLLKSLNDIREAASNIKIGLNLDLGSEVSEKLNQKVSQATTRQLEAYRKLFSAMKGTGKTNKEIFQFYEPDDASVSELIGLYHGMIKRAEEKFKVGNSNTYKKILGSTYDDLKKEIKNANAQLGRAETKRSENGILSDLFGDSKDLTEVINQLSTIVSKLDEISMSANRFVDVFKDGLNVNASVEEIDKLTNRVKELESELSKIKTSAITTDESNISSGMKDASPNIDTKLDDTVTSAKELDKTLEQVDIPMDSFDIVLKKLDLAKSELVDIVKITKQSVSDADGKFHDSYTLKDSRGSTEIYGVDSKTNKGQILRQNIVGYDKKKDELDISKAQLEVDKQLAKEEDNLAKAQQKKAQAFLKEQANYEEDQKKAEFIKKQTAVYEELTNTISRYSEVAKRVAGGNAEDGDLELMTKLEDKISQLQKQPILSDSQVAKSEKSLVSLYDQLDKIERKLVKTNQESQDKLINGYDKRLESYTNKTSGYNATIERFNDGGWTSNTYLENVQAVKNAVKQYEDLLSDIKAKGGIASEKDIQTLNEYENTIKKTIATVSNMSASEKGYNFVSGQKELDKIHKLLAENSRMSSEAKAKIKAFYKEIESGNPSMSLDKIHGEIMKIVNAETEAGRAGKSMWAAIKEKAWYGAASAIGTYFGINDIFRYGGEAVQIVRELDTALTEMRKVSNESLQSLKAYQATTFDTADAVGTTAKQIQNSTADWMRLGESMDQAAESAKDANVLLNVSEFEGIDEATESLVSMSQAYKDLDKMDIIDVLNNIGNNYSISTDGLATALKDSASALVTANNDLNEAVSLTTAGNAITQDPSKVGAGLRTISLRLVGTEEAKQELSDLGEETDGMITTVSKLRDTIMDATKAASSDGKGFDILDSNGNYKSTYEIMQGLADLYDDIVKKDKELGTNNLNLLLETIAGKNRSNIAASILQNGDMLRSVYEDAQKSEGSAEQELNSYLDSIDGKMAQLQNSAQEFWFKVIDSETIKTGIDLLTSLVKGATDFVDTVGLLPTILTGIGAALSFKNVGRDKMYSLTCFEYADNIHNLLWIHRFRVC